MRGARKQQRTSQRAVLASFSNSLENYGTDMHIPMYLKLILHSVRFSLSTTSDSRLGFNMKKSTVL